MATLKLGSISTIADGLKIGSIMLGRDAIGASVTVATDAAKSINLNNASGKNYGSLNIDKDGNMSLRVSSLDGEVEIAGPERSGDINPVKKLTSVSFTSTKGVQTTLDVSDTALKNLKTATFGSGKDSVSVTGTLGEEFVLNTGAGKDVISLSASSADENAKIIAGAGDDIVIVGGEVNYNNVALGAGKDTVKFSDNATVKLTDYKYNEDVIISSQGQATLTNDGTLKLGSAGNSVVSGIAASNNLYLAKVNSGTNTTMYATAAEDSAKVDVNASSIEDKNVIIDTTSADSATITTGKATLTAVTLNTAEDSANTIKIGDASAKNSVAVTGFDGDDVLSFAGLSFAKTTIGLGNSSDATLTNGKVSLNLGANVTVDAVKADNSNHDKAAVKFNLNDKTLYATTTDDQVIDLTEEEDITKVLVAGQNVLGNNYSGIKTSAQLVDLGSSNFHNINMVVLTEDTAAKASVIGTNKTKTGVTINASDAADGVAVWANNSSTSQTDKIIFGGANDVADTLWLGSNDGHDVVEGFDFESDVLYLADANSMKVEGGVIKVGKSKMTVDSATSEIMQVQGAKFAGTYYVAGDFKGDDKVVVLGENAGQANYYAVGKKAAVEITAEMTDTYTFLKDIDYAGASKANIAAGGSVASINAGTTSEDAKVIVEGVANVTLGAGTNEVWVNGAAATGNVELSGGSDKVWFGASDKIVKVSNYDADSDVIALIGNTMDYKAKKDADGNVVITAGTSKLKVATASEFLNVVDSTGAAYKVYAGTATDTANYTTNTESRNIFVGIGTLTNDGTIDENTTLVVNGANNQWGLQSAAVVDKSVKTIDMSGSSADFTLVGSSTVNNTITGGTGTNYLNGGGASKDTLNGVTGAVDNFYYGKGDGDDTLVNVEADDFVQLYNVSAADIATIKADDPSNVVITMNDKSKLTINGLTDGATFVLTDGVYTYDSTAEGSKFTKL